DANGLHCSSPVCFARSAEMPVGVASSGPHPPASPTAPSTVTKHNRCSALIIDLASRALDEQILRRMDSRHAGPGVSSLGIERSRLLRAPAISVTTDISTVSLRAGGGSTQSGVA